MLTEAAEFLPNVEEPKAVSLQAPSETGARQGMPRAGQDSAGLEFAAFLLVLMLIVWCCWPGADDQMMLQSALLYALILNSN
jgi:hypothetical protein